MSVERTSLIVIIINVKSALRRESETTDQYLDISVSSTSVSCRRAHFHPGLYQTQMQDKWMDVDSMIDYREIDGIQSDRGHAG